MAPEPMAPPPMVPEPSMPDFDDLNPDTPHLAGWHRNGEPVYQGTHAEWTRKMRYQNGTAFSG
jgi:hypothetical protein